MRIEYGTGKDVSIHPENPIINNTVENFRHFYDSVIAQESVIVADKAKAGFFTAPSSDGLKSKASQPLTSLLIIDGDSGAGVAHMFTHKVQGKPKPVEEHCAPSTESAIKAMQKLGFEFCIYSSYSNMNIPPQPEPENMVEPVSLSEADYKVMASEWYRWRVIVPLSRTVNAEEYTALAIELFRQMGIQSCHVSENKESKSLSQLWFTPSYPDESRQALAVNQHHDGNLLPVDEWLGKIEALPKKAPSKCTSVVDDKNLLNVENACLRLIRELKNKETYSIRDYLLEHGGFTDAGGNRLAAPGSNNKAGCTIKDEYSAISSHQNSDPYVSIAGGPYNLTDCITLDYEIPALWHWLKRWAESDYDALCHPLANGRGGRYKSLTEAFSEPECCLFEGKEAMQGLSLFDDEEPPEDYETEDYEPDESESAELICLAGEYTNDDGQLQQVSDKDMIHRLSRWGSNITVTSGSDGRREFEVADPYYTEQDQWGKIVNFTGYLEPADYMTASVEEIISKPVRFPSWFFSRRGLLGTLVQYSFNHARLPVMQNSVMGSLICLGVMCQAKYVSDDDDFIQLAAEGLSGTGGGKDAVQRFISDVLRDSNLGDSVLKQVKSANALKESLYNAPNHVGLRIVDEAGLAKDKKADNLNSELRELELTVLGGGTAGSVLEGYTGRGKGKQDNSVSDIQRPHYFKFGMSTLAAYEKSLNSERAAAGDLNRVLLFEFPEGLPRQKEDRKKAKKQLRVNKASVSEYVNVMRRVEDCIFSARGSMVEIYNRPRGTESNKAESNSHSIYEVAVDELIKIELTDEAAELSQEFNERFQCHKFLEDGRPNKFYSELQGLSVNQIWRRSQQSAKVISCIVAISDFMHEMKNEIDQIQNELTAEGEDSDTRVWWSDKVQERLKESRDWNDVTIPLTAEHVKIGNQLVFYCNATASRLYSSVAHGELNKWMQFIKEQTLLAGGSIFKSKLTEKLTKFEINYAGQDLETKALEKLKAMGSLVEYKGPRGGVHYVSVEAVANAIEYLASVVPQEGWSSKESVRQMKGKPNVELMQNGSLSTKRVTLVTVQCAMQMLTDSGSSQELRYKADTDMIFPA